MDGLPKHLDSKVRLEKDNGSKNRSDVACSLYSPRHWLFLAGKMGCGWLNRIRAGLVGVIIMGVCVWHTLIPSLHSHVRHFPPPDILVKFASIRDNAAADASAAAAAGGGAVSGADAESVRFPQQLQPLDRHFNVSSTCIDTIRHKYGRPGERNERVQSRIDTCHVELCHALQAWACQAKRRDAQLESAPTRPTSSSSGSRGRRLIGEVEIVRDDPGTISETFSRVSERVTNPFERRLLYDEDELHAQQRAGVGLVCSRAWRHSLLHRVAHGRHRIGALDRGKTNLSAIARGVDNVCEGVRRVEEGLTSAADTASSKACSQWPEACWPLPNVPFSILSKFASRKYLVLAFHMEQLSNARSHLIEAARVAEAAGRVLVLPKGGNSRLSIARPHPICSYWDLSRIATVEWVSPEFFLLMQRAAVENPSVGLICLQTASLNRPCFDFKETTSVLGELLAYSLGHVPVEGNLLDIMMPKRGEVMDLLMKAWSDKDVVVWIKTTYERVDLTPHTDHISAKILPYRKDWHREASRLVAHLPKPIVAVHFRSEFVSWIVATRGTSGKIQWQLWKQMAMCTRAAAAAIIAARKLTNAPTVFIAADVPFNASSGVLRSDSWDAIVQRFGAQNTLATSHKALRWLRWRLGNSTMIDELMPSINSYDPGIVAIIDKLICAQAEVLVAGDRMCGGLRGFEADILQHREVLGKTNSTVFRWGNNTLVQRED